MARSAYPFVLQGASAHPSSPAESLSPLQRARWYVARPFLWKELCTPLAEGRRYHLLDSSETAEVWLIAWSPGVRLEMHDHGGVSGAFFVVQGTLLERWMRKSDELQGEVQERLLLRGQSVAFDAGHLHEVSNPSESVAFSIHAYRPRLRFMNFYALETQGDWQPHARLEHEQWHMESTNFSSGRDEG